MIVEHNPIFHTLSILMYAECDVCGVKFNRNTCKHYYGDNDPKKPKTLLADFCNTCGFEKKPKKVRRPKPVKAPVKKMRKRVANRARGGRR